MGTISIAGKTYHYYNKDDYISVYDEDNNFIGNFDNTSDLEYHLRAELK